MADPDNLRFWADSAGEPGTTFRDRSILVAAILVVAAGLLWGTARVTALRLRAERLAQARVAAQAVDVAALRSLTGSAEDLGTSSYMRLKARLAGLRQASPWCRFLYVTGRRDGEIFFFADSLAPEQEAYAPPGLIYEEASVAFHRAFETGQEGFVGPVTDRWGRFVTAIIPLGDPSASEVVAVLGMDVEAGRWHLEILRQSLIPFTSILLSALLVLLVILQRQHVNARRVSQERWRSLTEMSPDLVFAVDRELTIQFANRGWPGLTAEEIVGTPVYADVESEGPASIREVLEGVLVSGEDAAYEAAYRKPDGSMVHYGFRVAPRRLPKGDEIAGLILSARDVSERKRARRALEESERRYEELFDKSRDGFVMVDAGAQIVDANQAYCEMLGYSLEELRGLASFYEITPERWRAWEQEEIWEGRLLTEGYSGRYQKEYVRKDGTVFPVELQCYTVFDDHGTPLYLWGIARDITERRISEDLLQRRNRELSLLHRASRAFTSTLDLDEVLTTVLEEVRSVFDVVACSVWLLDAEEEELICEQAIGPHSDLVRGQRLRPGAGLAGWAVERGESVIVANALEDERHDVTVDEATGLDVRSVLSVPLQVKDDVIGVLQVVDTEVGRFGREDVVLLEPLAASAAVAIENASLYDRAQQEIAARRGTESALRASEERFRSLVEQSTYGIALTDGNGRVLEWNAALEAISGLDADAVLGRPVWDAIQSLATERGRDLLDGERLRQAIDAGVEPEEGVWQGGVMEQEIRHPDGTVQTVHLTLFPIQTSEHQVYASIVRDVTERKEMERELNQQAKLAAVGQLASGIAHDFNNILGAIILYAQMPLAHADLTPEIKDAFETILEESRRAADLVNQIRDFSRSARMSTEPVDLAALVEEALGLLERTVPAHIDVTAHLDSDPCTIQADATRIHQILMNLALNARDAMPQGGELRIGVEERLVSAEDNPPVSDMDAGVWCCLTVSDTGTGLSEEAQAHLFEPFFTTKEERGTGLGLAQVYGIVNQHGGFIDVETAPGEGTTFTIFFPNGDDPAEGAGRAVESHRPVAGAQPNGESKTILVVEDGRQLRTAIKSGLEPLDYLVITAADGEEALDAVSQYSIDLVLTDLVMPKMGGEVLLRRLRDENPELKVVAMTGHVVDRDIPSLRDAGFNAALPKPFSIDDLLAIVTDTLEGAQD